MVDTGEVEQQFEEQSHAALMIPSTLILMLGGLGYALSSQCSGADLDGDIRKYRMGTLVVQAPAGTSVRVSQVRHEFWFGAALASQLFSPQADADLVAKYQEVFLENFNAAVTENALKWHSMERRRGDVHYETVDAILAWTEDHDIPLRGHNVFWGVPNFVPQWQKDLDDEELLEYRQSPGPGYWQTVSRTVRRIRSQQRDDARELLRAAIGTRYHAADG